MYKLVVPIAIGSAASLGLLYVGVNYDAKSIHGARESNFSRVEILYGTDRAALPLGRGYANKEDADKHLTTGICTVTVPKYRRQGEISSPNWLKLEFKVDPAKHFSLEGVRSIDQDTFLKEMDLDSANDTFLFVHGFNNTFEDAAFRTAQMAADMELKGRPMLYSWASHADLLKYRDDGDVVDRTQAKFYQFLRDALDHSGSRKIHLIAHSMGTQVLTTALKRLPAEYGPKIGEIVLLAADLDKESFQTAVFEQIVPRLSSHMTSYCSSKDIALDLSKFTKDLYPRVGQSGKDLVVMAGLTTIDASYCSEDCGMCHSLPGIPCVLDDLRLFLAQGLAPEKRLLHAELSGSQRYYRLTSGARLTQP